MRDLLNETVVTKLLASGRKFTVPLLVKSPRMLSVCVVLEAASTSRVPSLVKPPLALTVVAAVPA
ncbi:hypothetical protein D3C83_289930 [compost metagenome]